MVPRSNQAAASGNRQQAVGGGKAANFTPAAKGTKPSLTLKFKNEQGKWETITGLFESEKDGEVYYKGTDKNSGVSYLVASYKEKKKA